MSRNFEEDFPEQEVVVTPRKRRVSRNFEEDFPEQEVVVTPRKRRVSRNKK